MELAPDEDEGAALLDVAMMFRQENMMDIGGSMKLEKAPLYD